MNAGTAPGLVLEYLGHSAFLSLAPDGTRILVDPYGQPHEARPAPSYGQPASPLWFVSECPLRSADAVLVTHPHFDHDAVHRASGCPSIIRDPLTVRIGEVGVKGYLGLHAGAYGKEFGQRNVVFVLDSGPVTICHLGDNRVDLPAPLLARDRPVDVLIVPVDDGCHLLEFDEVEQVIHDCDPRVIIPVHYHLDEITHPESGLGSIDRWLVHQRRPVRRKGSRVELNSATLPCGPEVWTMRPSALT